MEKGTETGDSPPTLWKKVRGKSRLMGARERKVRVTYINGIRTGEEDCRAHAELIGEMFAAPCHFYHNKTAGAWADLSQVGSCIDTNRCAPVCPSLSFAEHRQAMLRYIFFYTPAEKLVSRRIYREARASSVAANLTSQNSLSAPPWPMVTTPGCTAKGLLGGYRGSAAVGTTPVASS